MSDHITEARGLLKKHCVKGYITTIDAVSALVEVMERRDQECEAAKSFLETSLAINDDLTRARSHLAEIAANIGDIEVAEIIPAIRKFTSALVEIDGNSPAKEPSNYHTVGFPPARPDEDDGANELVREAFEEGVIRGRWEMANLARQAL